MEFRVLFIGCQEDIDLLKKEVLPEEKHILPILYVLTEFNQENLKKITQTLASLEQEADGVIYLRKEYYTLISKGLVFTIPSRYVELEELSLRLALFRLRLNTDMPFSSVSVDYMTVSDFKALSKDHDLFQPDPKIWCMSPSYCSRRDSQQILREHYRNLENGADAVLTSLPQVYEELRTAGKKVLFVQLNPAAIHTEIRTLIAGIRLSRERDRVAVIYVHIRYKRTAVEIVQMQIRELEELASVTREVSLYAHALNGSAIPLSRWEYLILCDENSLIEETRNFTEISLFRQISTSTVFNAHLCIGIGSLAKTAYESAMVSYAVGVSIQSTNAVITEDITNTWEPILYDASSTEDVSLNDETLFDISARSHISYESIQKLYVAAHRKDSPVFFSQDIADALNISVRSANRMITRLLDSGCASIVNTVSLNQVGRPNRVIRLHF